MRQYWPISELAMIGGIAVKGKRMIPFQLQKQILWQLHSNLMGIERQGSWHVNQYIW